MQLAGFGLPASSGLASSLVRSLFDSAVSAAEARPELVDDQLFSEELVSIDGAVFKRRAEFGTARVCARRALSALGVEPVPLPPKQNRSPSWPAGVVGSISHTKSYCAVVVARDSSARSVGLDVEEERTLDQDMVRTICTANERRVLAQRGTTDRDAILYFSAKEAFYKCQYPLLGIAFGFQDVEIEYDFVRDTFRARILRPNLGPAWLGEMKGRFKRRNGLVLCGTELH